jgi:hypothetical protein
MASNLSELITDGINKAVSTVLSKEAISIQVIKVNNLDLDVKYLKIKSNFKFENIDSNWSFFIPRSCATNIFNLTSDEDLINEDMVGSLKDIVSKISDQLSSNINGSNFEDLGAVESSLIEDEIIDNNSEENINNLFKFILSLEDKEDNLFIEFDEQILPHIQSIETTIASEKPQEKEVDNLNNNDEQKVQESNSTSEEVPQEDEKLEDQKSAKLKKIIIVVGILFALVLTTGIVLYFMGAFEPEVIEKPKDKNITIEKEKIVPIDSKPIKKHINFTMSQIDVERLNKKLYLLTKYEILEEDAIERLKAIEKEKLYKEKQKKLELFAKNNKEEPLFQKKATYDNEDTNETIVLNSFVQIPTLKLKKFKRFIKHSKKVAANLSICKDKNGRTQIFVGPFVDKKSRQRALDLLNKQLLNEVKQLDLSNKDFEQMCSF